MSGGGYTFAVPVGMNDADTIHSIGASAKMVASTSATCSSIVPSRFMASPSYCFALHAALYKRHEQNDDEQGYCHRRGVTHAPPAEPFFEHQQHKTGR